MPSFGRLPDAFETSPLRRQIALVHYSKMSIKISISVMFAIITICSATVVDNGPVSGANLKLRILSKQSSNDIEAASARKTHIKYAPKYPSNCRCALGNGPKTGTCYDFTVGKYCKSRPCKPSYFCVHGVSSKYAITCIRKKNLKKVVSK